MVIPPVYRQSPTTIVSYDYQDIATGTGMEVMYLVTSEDSTGVKKTINQSKIYVSDTTTQEGADATGSTKIFDVDFDLSAFNKPRTLRGTARFHFSFQVDITTVAGTGYAILKLRKYDGTTETEIGSIQTVAENKGAQYEQVVDMDLTKTKFQKGDILRLTVEGYATPTAGTFASTFKIWHEPLSATEANIFECRIPFEIKV